MSLSQDEVKTLKAPFPSERLGVKVQSFSKDRTKAMLVCYLQHTDVMDRLDQVDPDWTSTVLNEERAGDTVYVRMRMTLKGISRENVGEGGDPKGAYSDALKRCAMLFGIGRYLYDSETVWTNYDDQRDRFRAWSYDDYKACLRSNQKGVPLGQAEEDPLQSGKRPIEGWSKEEKKAVAPRTNPEKQVKKKREAPTADENVRDALMTKFLQLHRPYMSRFPQRRFSEILVERYAVGEPRLMTSEQIEDLIEFLEASLQGVS